MFVLKEYLPLVYDVDENGAAMIPFLSYPATNHGYTQSKKIFFHFTVCIHLSDNPVIVFLWKMVPGYL
jgi:hypothetical protein